MSDFKFKCPHCQQSLEAPDEMLGTVIDCPSCKGRIQLPIPQPQSRPKAPPPSAPVPQKKLGMNRTQAPAANAAGKTRPCPFCGEEILAIAIK